VGYDVICDVSIIFVRFLYFSGYNNENFPWSDELEEKKYGFLAEE